MTLSTVVYLDNCVKSYNKIHTVIHTINRTIKLMQKLVHPQEVEVFYLLPAIRRDLAISLKESGMDQKQIAKLLGISEPSVSHYFNSKRATEVEFTEAIKKEIKKSSKNIKTSQDVVKETQRIIKLITSEKEICKVCHEVNKESVSKTCQACYD